MKKFGYTLVEVLVVIVVVAIIAAIAFSIIAPAKKKAAQTVCLNTLRQIAKAVLIYAELNDGGTGHSTLEVPWLELVSPKSQGVLRCSDLDEWRPFGPVREYDMGGFALNTCNHRRVPAIETSKTILVTEAARFVSPLGRSKGSYQPQSLTGPDIYELAPEVLIGQLTEGFVPINEFGAVRHKGGSNYALSDGHVKWLRPSQLRLPMQGYGCQDMATVELKWQGPEDAPYFSAPNLQSR